MRWPARLLVALLALGAAGTGNAGPDATPARDWIAQASGRPGAWTDHGLLELPSGMLFVGDPTWGDDYHIRDPRRLATAALRVFSRSDEQGRNLALWLEAAGGEPKATGERIEFGVDAATVALGDLEGGRALVAWGESRLEKGLGDSFDWLSPILQEKMNFARWLPIPPDDRPIFIASTGMDGGLAAVWLLDERGSLSGILIDIAGRASDGQYLDTLLPAAQ
ncbi:hypothetical protein [Paracoccus denitrificans]|uniref:hypothetical protein n=1 Tax=Paracoccus denitrificans TaxID=266 RepID=UPI000CECD790|nr:hypothetical protein [Paracoccus denitrificans]